MATYAATQSGVPPVQQQGPSLLSRMRLFQIRAWATLLCSLGNRGATRGVLISLRSNSFTRAVLESSLGFRRAFSSFGEAQAAASRYLAAGHEHPDEVAFHAAISDIIRESDYPVLYFLDPVANQLRRVFDLGGSVGNVFYAYKARLTFSPALNWLVYDLPFTRPAGEQLARKRRETRVRFVDSLAHASGCDLFLASGSLHYFEQPLHQMLGGLEELPRHVIVNRTPVSRGPDVITVQDNQSFLVPCKLHSRATLVAGMQSLGYQLEAEWPVHERKLLLPLDPQLSARTYSGFYFRKN